MEGERAPDKAADVLQDGIAFTAAGKAGPYVLLLHGFGSDRMSWGLNQPALSAFARTVALDLPAHGDSDAEAGDGTIAALADRVAGFLAARGVGPAHLVGHSLGGAIAVELAHRHPYHAASLVLIAPAGLGRGVVPSFLAGFPEMTSVDQATAVLRPLVSRPRLLGPRTAARALVQLSRPGVRDVLRRIARGLAEAETVLAPAIRAVGTSKLPRHVVWGKEDTTNPLDEVRLAAFGGTLTVLDGVRHLPHVEVPARVNALLSLFLRTEPFCPASVIG